MYLLDVDDFFGGGKRPMAVLVGRGDVQRFVLVFTFVILGRYINRPRARRRCAQDVLSD